jgi:DNA-directed RNA polymerase subunit RPC12/RpoP
METTSEKTQLCVRCGAEADITLEGFEKVEDVIKRQKKGLCKNCGQEIELKKETEETPACRYCGAESDMTLEGVENVADVIHRERIPL